MNEFLQKIWENNEQFIFHIASDSLRIFFTFIFLKLIFIFGNLFYKEKPIILEYMEFLSTFGLIAIFFILIIFDFYDFLKIKRKAND